MLRGRAAAQTSAGASTGVPGMAAASLLLIAAAIAGKPITFLRDVVVAREFGANSVVDFVILAQLLPLALVGVVSAGIMFALPHVFRAEFDRSGDAIAGLARGLSFTHQILLSAAVLLGVGGLVAALALILVQPGGAPFPPLLMAILAGQALLESGVVLYGQLLQIRGNFRRPALQFAVNGLVTIAVVLALGPRIGVIAWPLGMLLDSAWQIVLVRSGLPRRTSARSPPLSLRETFATASGPIAMYAFTVIYLVTDRVAGLTAGVGVLAVWTWAIKLQNAAIGVVGLPLAQVLFSRGHVARDREPQLYGAIWIVSVALAALAAGGYAVIGPPIVEFLFSSEKLNATDLDRLTTLAGLALIAAIPLTMFTVASRALMAKGRFRDPLVSVAAGAILYPAAVFATIEPLGYASLGTGYIAASAVAGGLCTWAATRDRIVQFRGVPAWTRRVVRTRWRAAITALRDRSLH